MRKVREANEIQFIADYLGLRLNRPKDFRTAQELHYTIRKQVKQLLTIQLITKWK